jgi:hypothetical protein
MQHSHTEKELKKIILALPFKFKGQDKPVFKSGLPLARIYYSLCAGLKVKPIVTLPLIIELLRSAVETHDSISEREGADEDKLIILAGDYYFSQALSLMGSLTDKSHTKMIYNKIREACLGDILVGLSKTKKQAHLRKQKGSLYALPFELAAASARLPKSDLTYFSNCGYDLGLNLFGGEPATPSSAKTSSRAVALSVYNKENKNG